MEIICTESYKELCDYYFDKADNVSLSNYKIIGCKTYNIKNLFSILEKENQNYIIVSDAHDTGLIGLDNKIYRADTNNVYEEIIIPKNIIKWFCVNANIDNEKICPIPLGILKEGLTDIQNVDKNNKKIYDIYFNMTIHESYRDRWNFAHIFKNQPNVLFYANYLGESHSLSTKQHYEYISQSKSTVCLSGNGFDCYRNLESLYLNSIPIYMRYEPYQLCYSDLLKIILNYNFDFYMINEICSFNMNYKQQLNKTKADFNYWKDKITSK